MKKVVLVLLIFSTLICNGQRNKIQKVDILEKGFNVNVTLEPIVDELTHQGLTYKITPISADKLNSYFLKENWLNGKFNYSHYESSISSYFLKKRRAKKNRMKSDYEFLIEGLTYLLENNIITYQEYEELAMEILIDFYPNDPEIKNSLDYNISANPYYINNKYLSVFKIEISNHQNKGVLFDSEIIVSIGDNIFLPLKDSFLITELSRGNMMNNNKAMSLKRNNIPTTYIVPSNSKVIKYFAIMPIDYSNNRVFISWSGLEKSFEWEIISNEQIIDDKYTFYRFDSYYRAGEYGGKINRPSYMYNIIKCPTSSVFMNHKDIYIDAQRIYVEFDLFSLILKSDILYYGRNINLKGASYLDRDRIKRESIQIPLIKIDDLKKKVKLE